MPRAANLLDSLLPGFNASAELRAPGALRLVVARALGSLDLPPYASLGDFVDALARFAAQEPTPAVVRRLFRTWSAAVEAQPGQRSLIRTEPVSLDGDWLTVSDIRCARRATGLTLAQVAEASRIPAWLLRELEWGYFQNWPAGLYGRTQLIRYAHATRLDEKIIVLTIWPLLEEHARERGAEIVAPAHVRPAQAVEPGMMLVPIESGPLVQMQGHAAKRRRVAAALAIPALLVVALLPGLWERSSPPPEQGTYSAMTVRQADGGKATPRSAETLSPAFTSAGSAVFYPTEFADQDRGAGYSTLRITRVVDDESNNFHARPSPDGRHIAFDSDREGERAVFIADADGRNVRRASGDGLAAVPSWSPDGRVLAFARAEADYPEVWNLWTVKLETGETRRLTSYRTGQTSGGSWFPDGRRITYGHEGRLIILDSATARARAFVLPLKRRVDTPAVSPDGRRVIFQVEDDGVWMLELRDGSLRRVLQDPSANAYAWAPDGRRVAYHSCRSGRWNVWVLSPETVDGDP